MKKVLAFLVLFFVSISNVSAQTKLTLIQEDYMDGSLVRSYENPETKIGEIVFIKIPTELVKEVEKADNKTLEAKKLLMNYYTEHKMSDEIKQLKNEKLVKRNEQLELAPFMVDIFAQQSEIVQNYVILQQEEKKENEKPKKEVKSENSYGTVITISSIVVIMGIFLLYIFKKKDKR